MSDTVKDLLQLADDMENAMHGGPEFIGRTGLRFNASERIRRIVRQCEPVSRDSEEHIRGDRPDELF